MDPKISKKTQDTLGKLIKKPPLTDKLLSKPPFRFLHDVVTSVIKTTGVMKGLYTDSEMNSENVKDKEGKIAFLQKAVDFVGAATGKQMSVKPVKIVAGHEPEKTNEFLQALAAAINSKVDNEEVVNKVTGKGGSSKKEEKKDERKEEKSRDREKSGDRRKRGDEEKRTRDRSREKGRDEKHSDRDSRHKDREERHREKEDRHREKEDRHKEKEDRHKDKDRDRESRHKSGRSRLNDSSQPVSNTVEEISTSKADLAHNLVLQKNVSDQGIRSYQRMNATFSVTKDHNDENFNQGNLEIPLTGAASDVTSSQLANAGLTPRSRRDRPKAARRRKGKQSEAGIDYSPREYEVALSDGDLQEQSGKLSRKLKQEDFDSIEGSLINKKIESKSGYEDIGNTRKNERRHGGPKTSTPIQSPAKSEVQESECVMEGVDNGINYDTEKEVTPNRKRIKHTANGMTDKEKGMAAFSGRAMVDSGREIDPRKDTKASESDKTKSTNCNSADAWQVKESRSTKRDRRRAKESGKGVCQKQDGGKTRERFHKDSSFTSLLHNSSVKKREEDSKENDAPQDMVNGELKQDGAPSKMQRPSSAKGSRRRMEAPVTFSEGGVESSDEDVPAGRQEPMLGGNEDAAPQAGTGGRLARPSSARPAPPKRKEDTAQIEPALRLGSGKPQNLIIDDGKDSDEDETFVVEEAAPQPMEQEPTLNHHADDDDDEDHGGLVKKIMESKKEYEQPRKTEIERPTISDAQRRKQREAVQKEIDKLRTSIQTLTRSANPLGKIMDFVQEDLDSMQKELEKWKAENKEHTLALKREKAITERAVEPLKVQLSDVDQSIKDQLDLIGAVKSNIIRNDQKIEKMLRTIAKS